MADSPTRSDPLAARLSDRFGGPAGNHSGVRPDGSPGGHWWWTPLRVALAVLTLTMALSLVHEKPCMGTNWNNDAVRYSKACYSDIPYLYTARGGATQQWPYATKDPYQRLEYPVGIGYFTWFTSEVTALAPAGPSAAIRDAAGPDSLWGLPGMSEEINEYFIITALLLFGCALLATWFLGRADPRRPWDALMFALSPVLCACAFVNWDLLAVMASAGALWAYARKRPIWAGFFIALGTSFKLYPLFLLGAVVALALRDRNRAAIKNPVKNPVNNAVITTVTSVGCWVLMQIPAWLGSVSAWTYFWQFNAKRAPDLGSLWLVAEHMGASYSISAMNAIQWVAMAIICVAVAALAWWAPKRPSLAQLGYLLTVGFLITNKVYSPQYVLWLLPLAILARPKWRDQLIWQAGELFYFFMVWWYLGGYLNLNVGSTFGLYAVGIFVRIAVELYLVVMILRDLLLEPSTDELEHGDAIRAVDHRELMA